MKDGLFCPPTNCTVTVTTVMRSRLSSFQTGKTAPLGFVETASLQGIFWNTVCFCRPQRESQARSDCAVRVARPSLVYHLTNFAGWEQGLQTNLCSLAQR
ncbi:hypothetical protein ILYODFUR_032718 [Ilyodon furcidens]|uniref:Uncharacterized protein n=1 Tax=Ilyodon furcidens TaxID=33524 RepID=A0ABV0TZP2_9TELE